MAVATGALLRAPVAPAAAQSPASAPPPGVIAGMVHDSLFARGPLADAELLIEGLARPVRTDARGRFRIDGVPAGRWRVTFTHASLDAVGLAAPVREVEVVAGRSLDMTLATPAPATVHAALCGGPPPAGTSLVIGGVRAGADSAPLPIARARGAWDEVVIRRGGTARERPMVEGVVTAGGAFALCRVPSDAELVVSVLLDDGRATATVLAIDGVPALGVALVAGPAPLPSGADAAVGWRGRVVGASGEGLAQVVVRAAEGGAQVRTGDGGAFALATGGTGAIEVRAVGQRPLLVDPLPGARAWTLILHPLGAQALGAVRVTGRRDEGTEEPPGFWARQRRGEGTFISRAQIEQRNPQFAAHLLEAVPGLRLDPDGRVTVNRGGGILDRCEPLYFFDGVRLFTGVAESPLMGLPPSDIAGIEVYRGAAQLPLQFGGSESTCGAIVVWTRRGKWRSR